MARCQFLYFKLMTHSARGSWQSISCGLFWFAHVGGAQLSRHNGPRREFLVIGNGLLKAAEALDEATIGTLVVSHKLLTFLGFPGHCRQCAVRMHPVDREFGDQEWNAGVGRG